MRLYDVLLSFFHCGSVSTLQCFSCADRLDRCGRASAVNHVSKVYCDVVIDSAEVLSGCYFFMQLSIKNRNHINALPQILAI